MVQGSADTSGAASDAFLAMGSIDPDPGVMTISAINNVAVIASDGRGPDLTFAFLEVSAKLVHY